jgi:hypothetical protein
MAEWLRLDETVEKFGIKDCNVGYDECARKCECKGTGKIIAPWAKYAKEGE